VTYTLLPSYCLQPKERDRVEGGWYAYHPIGGAITVLAKGAASNGSASNHEAVQHSTMLASSAAPTAGRSAGSLTAAAGARTGSESVFTKPKGCGPVIEVISSSNGGIKTAAAAVNKDTSLLKP
jgi:hypothetical protein